jgi:putative phosphoesterase
MTPARSKQPHRRSRTDTKNLPGRRRPPSGVSGRRAAGSGRARPLRIGIIADTHGLVRPEALDALRGVDHILHAGDIGGAHVLEELRAIAPVTFVRGNNDEDDGYDIIDVTLGDTRILLTHILPRPRDLRPAIRQALTAGRPHIVVFGHSHLPHNEVIDDILFFNPASAGPRRFDYPVSVGIIEGGRAYHVALDVRSQGALTKRMNQLQ